jgi:hypothetical protein
MTSCFFRKASSSMVRVVVVSGGGGEVLKMGGDFWALSNSLLEFH